MRVGVFPVFVGGVVPHDVLVVGLWFEVAGAVCWVPEVFGDSGVFELSHDSGVFDALFVFGWC